MPDRLTDIDKMLIKNARQLQDLGRDLPEQLQLPVDKGDLLELTQVMRYLPGRRLAGAGRWCGRDVFIKLFFGGKAEKEFGREQRMAEHLRQGNVRAPRLLRTGSLPEGGFWLVQELLPEPVPLLQYWDSCEASAKPVLFQQLLELINTLYQAGIYQADAHLENFALSDGKLYALDAGGIKPLGLMRRSRCLSNLSLLIAQFNWREQVQLVDWANAFFVDATGPLSGCQKPVALSAVVKSWRQRLRKISAKSLRNCTMVFEKRLPGSHLLLRRALCSEALIEQVDSSAKLDRLIDSGSMLKDGNSATVVKAVVAGQPVVIKRYNLKNRWIAFKRLFQTSRARHSWYNAHLLEFMHLVTPAPIALLEEKWGPFTRRAYLITAWSAGESFGDMIDSGKASPEQATLFADLFQGLERAGVSHGDMKATNFLLDENGIKLIDLDAMRFHSRSGLFEKRFQKDRRRFLANWAGNAPEIFRRAASAQGVDGTLL